LDVYLL